MFDVGEFMLMVGVGNSYVYNADEREVCVC